MQYFSVLKIQFRLYGETVISDIFSDCEWFDENHSVRLIESCLVLHVDITGRVYQYINSTY